MIDNRHEVLRSLHAASFVIAVALLYPASPNANHTANCTATTGTGWVGAADFLAW